MTGNLSRRGGGVQAPWERWTKGRIRRFAPPEGSVLETEIDRLRQALESFPESGSQATSARSFLAFLASSPEVFLRRHGDGHFTGSAWLVSADGERVLLMHHRKLGRWLQPGGHADGDADLGRVALREAQEETGISGLQLEDGVFDLDRHRIPSRGDEPAHWHYDVRYVIRAAASEAFTANAESLALAWREIATVAVDQTLDASLRRMAARWLATHRATSPRR